MMELLKRSGSDEGLQRRVGKITMVVSAGRYRVTDNLGRTFPAESLMPFRLGDRVLVLGEIIISLDGQAHDARVYEV